LLLVGCSSTSATGAADAGADTAAPVNRPARPPVEGDAGTCASDCGARHPDGVEKDRALVACWERRCNDVCVRGIAADAGAPDAGTCGAVAVVTPSAACDACTRERCCAEWTTCFSDASCAAYNACLGTCP